MSDNLAHKLNSGASNPGKFSGFPKLEKPTINTKSTLPKNTAPKKPSLDNIAPGQSSSQELELKRRRYQATKLQSTEQNPSHDDLNNLEHNEQNQEDENIDNHATDNRLLNAGHDQKDVSYLDNKNQTQPPDSHKNDWGQKKQDDKDENKTKDQPPSKNPPGLGPKIEKENLKIPEKKSTTKSDESSKKTEPDHEDKGTSAAQKINQAKNVASKALSGDLIGAGEEAVGATTQVGSQWLLTTLWGAVWLDWTLLTLLGLNVFLAFSLLLPNYVCQFGDDYLIGKWLPKDLAKWTEIIILMIIDAFVLMIIILTIVLIYKMIACGTWDRFNIFLSGVLPGGETALSAAEKQCF